MYIRDSYESVHADENYGLGGGWTSNFSYALEFDGRSVIAHLPRAVTLYFPIGFDGSFDTVSYTHLDVYKRQVR